MNDAIDDAQKRVDALQEFENACNDFRYWISGANDKIRKCAVVNDERDKVAAKLNSIKHLLEDDEGPEKLRAVNRLCELAKSGVSPAEGESLDEQVSRVSLACRAVNC